MSNSMPKIFTDDTNKHKIRDPSPRGKRIIFAGKKEK